MQEVPHPFEHVGTHVPLSEFTRSISELVYHQDGGLV